MKREDLKALELEDDVVDQIMKLHGQDIEDHKSKLEAAEKQTDDLQGRLDEANKTIEGFKDLDVDSIKKAADDWKAKAEQAEKDAKTQIEQLKFDHALEGALLGAKAKNPKAVKALLDMEALKYNEGKIIGLEDQLKAIQEKEDYLFESDEPTPKIVDKTSGKGAKLDEFTASLMKGAELLDEK
jgi:small-conductance mechanosensitive channel